MKAIKSNLFYKALAFVFAIAFTLLFLPISELYSLTASATNSSSVTVDYTYMTIGTDASLSGQSVNKKVKAGGTYSIVKAYIGGYSTDSEWYVGNSSKNSQLINDTDDDYDVYLISSSVTVKYGSTSATDDITVTTDNGDTSVYGTFTADKVGNYVITYYYKYEMVADGASVGTGTTYENYYDLTITSYLSSASMEFTGAETAVFPSVIDLALLSDGNEGYNDIELPVPTVYDEDGEEVSDYTITLSANDISTSGSTLYIYVTGGASGYDVYEKNSSYLTYENSKVTLDGAVFASADFGPSTSNKATYTITYAYYDDGKFVTSTTKSATVYGPDYGYYTNYYNSKGVANLEIATSSTLTTSAQPGVEAALPGVNVTTNSSVTPSGETVDVWYQVKVRYKSSTAKSYSDLDSALYAGVIDENGYLLDPTVFTPLQEGTYTFIYTAHDLYGNVISTAEGRYNWDDLEDETSPSAVVYDASVRDDEGNPTYEDASSKLKTTSARNGVIVYAIGIDDNLTTNENATLERIVYASSTELFTISGYADYNLIFNYRATSTGGTDAWQNFIDNNYLIRKAILADGYTIGGTEGETAITNNSTLLTYLKANHYLIVIDQSNYSEIYTYFSTEIAAASLSGVSDADTFLAWAQSATESELTALGFAYVDAEKTFGATSATNGYSYSSYSIRYYATDEAGLSAYTAYSITLSSSTDNTAPTITFSTGLSSTYSLSGTISFSVPTASDDNDSSSRMNVMTYYRYLSSSTALALSDNDATYVSASLLDDIYADICEQGNVVGNVKYELAYADFLKNDNTNSYYIDITDSEASTYEIDLSEAPASAQYVQILVYAYDDYGNVGIYATTANLANAVDEYAPAVWEVEEETVTGEYSQGDDVALPTVTVIDDNPEYLNYAISVYLVDDGSRTEVSSPINAYQSRSLSSNQYAYTVYGGTFSAPYAGDYMASIAVTDYSNNIIVTFSHYTVNAKIIIQDPVITVSLENQTVELDDAETIELPAPYLDYSLDNSLDYETYAKYKANNYYESTDEPNYVIVGINENGYVSEKYYTTTYGEYGSFTPTAIGEYAIKYTATVTIYNNTIFSYNVASGYTSVRDDKSLAQYYTIDSTTYSTAYQTLAIVTEDASTYTVYVYSDSSSVGSTTNNVSSVITINQADDGTLTYYASGDSKQFSDVSTSLGVTTETSITEWFDSLVVYELASDTFTVICQDTTGPTVKDLSGLYKDIDYDTINDSNETYELTIYGAEATDASGIDWDKSSISVTISYKRDGTTLTSYNTVDAYEGGTVEVSVNGTITISYDIYDCEGNQADAMEYTINAGDTEDPDIAIASGYDEEDFCASSYTFDDLQDGYLIFDLSLLQFSDNITASDDIYVEYVLTNDDTGEEIENEAGSDTTRLVYAISEVGDYTLTVTATDEADRYTTREFSFSIEEEEVDSTLVYKVVGTILIVISVLLLAGVIIYFIVAKVRLDKELKK